VEVQSVSPTFTQGSFQTTSSGLDLAVDGDGFFMVDQGSSTFYTRAGQFSLDQNGNIVNPDGLVLQGYQADAAGNITGTIGDLQIASSQSPANQSTVATISMNLDSTAAAPAAAFTLDGNGDGVNNDPVNFNSSTTVTVYDSQGGEHSVTAYFVKTAVANTWDVHYVQQDPANSSLLQESAATQTLTFDQNGLLTGVAGAAPSFDFGASVATPQTVTFDYGLGTNDASTQFASSFSVQKLSQDGYSAGSLQTVSISDSGVITGVFTNGQTRSIGQVALSRFIAPTQLTKMGNNLYAQSSDSGQAIVGTANNSGLGKVLSNSLELSNVDLATEFVKMISAQRGFQANSRIITTTDQLLQEVVNMKQ
jgi:flagellar hook protein FlgE